MSKFENVRKTIKRNRKKLHIMYVIIFTLILTVGYLYFQQYKMSTRDQIEQEYNTEMEKIIDIYENDAKSMSMKIVELEKINGEYHVYLDSLPFGNPVNDIIVVSEFGWRSDPFTDLRTYHYGIDLKVSHNDPIMSSGSGKIIFSGWKGGFGKCVIIRHTLGYTSLYAHLEDILVKEGDLVTKGKVIGLAGCSGRSSGVHLHYEIRKNGTSIDPFKYLQYFNTDELISY